MDKNLQKYLNKALETSDAKAWGEVDNYGINITTSNGRGDKHLILEAKGDAWTIWYKSKKESELLARGLCSDEVCRAYSVCAAIQGKATEKAKARKQQIFDSFFE